MIMKKTNKKNKIIIIINLRLCIITLYASHTFNRVMIILRLLLLLTNLHLKLLSTQGTGADKLLSTQRVKITTIAIF